jgi:hypothetical protein
MRKDRRYRKREIQLLYWRMKLELLDPEQSPQLAAIPLVIPDKRDWDKYTNSTKLMIMNYW